MTKFFDLSKALFQEKFRLANQVLGFSALAAVVITLYEMVRIAAAPGALFATFESVLGLASMLLYILLTVRNERVYTASTYRLIPVSNGKLYWANLITTFLSFAYFGLCSVIFALIFHWHMTIKAFVDGFSGSTFMLTVSIILTLIFAVLNFWALITLVHLLTEMISNFLPRAGQRISKIILVVVILYIFGRIVELISNVLILIAQHHTALLNANADLQFYLSPVYVIITLLIFSAINIYLLSSWVEAKPKNN